MAAAKPRTEQEKKKAIDRILSTEKSDMTNTYVGIGVGAMILCVFIGVIDMLGSYNFPFEWIDWVVFGILAFLAPIGFYVSSKESQTREIEIRLPDFLRDVAEAGRFGMTLADAIVVASTGRYGRLTPEIKKMAAQIEWGVPASEAIKLFSERVKTPLVTRMSSIIMKANDAGGNVADVLSMVSRDAKETILTQEERGVTMQTYVMVVYIAFFVFIATVLILQGQFLPKMEDAGQQVSDAAKEKGITSIPGVNINVDTIDKIGFIFFLSVIVHAVGDGILAGVIQKGSIAIGMRHAFIMLLVGFIVLRLFLGGDGGDSGEVA